MATSVTQSLFGMTPQAIQAQRAAQLDERALAFGQMKPMEAARAATFRAGSLFGDAAAGAMGFEDPEIAQAKQVQGLLSNANMNDPEGLMSLSQRLQSINPAAAQELAQRAMNMRKTQVETQRIEAGMQSDQAKLLQDQQSYQMRFEGLKSRHPNMTDEVARGLANDPAAFREAMKADRAIQETAEGVFIVDKNNPSDKVRIGAPVDRRSTTNVNVSNVTRQAGAVTGLVKDYDSLTKLERETLQTVTQAKSLINEAATANNSVAWESARTQIAKAVGEGRLSNEDIRRTGTDPRLVQGALDWVNKKIEGVPNQDIQRQLFAVATLLERSAVDKINSTAERTRAVGRLEGIPDASMDVLFPTIQQNNSPRRQPTGGAQTSRGTKYQIIEE